MTLAVLNESGFLTLTLVGLALIVGFGGGAFSMIVLFDIASRRDAKITAAFLKTLAKVTDSEVVE